MHMIYTTPEIYGQKLSAVTTQIALLWWANGGNGRQVAVGLSLSAHQWPTSVIGRRRYVSVGPPVLKRRIANSGSPTISHPRRTIA